MLIIWYKEMYVFRPNLSRLYRIFLGKFQTLETLRKMFIPPEAKDFSLLHIVQTGSEVHPASYLMDSVGCFPKVRAAGA
jgi:hypothetical protein